MVCCAHFFLDEALPRAPTKDMRLRPAGCQIWPGAIFDRLSRITRRGQRGPSKRRYFSSGPRKVYTAKPFDQGGGDQPKAVCCARFFLLIQHGKYRNTLIRSANIRLNKKPRDIARGYTLLTERPQNRANKRANQKDNEREK